MLTTTAVKLAKTLHNKKLSYHKQIARQRRTQYDEGIYSNSVTLKSRLGVTKGRWKVETALLYRSYTTYC